MTFEHSTGDHGEEKSMSCAEDFLVRTLVRQTQEPLGSKAQDLVSGGRCEELLMRYDPVLRSLKTHRCLQSGLISVTCAFAEMGYDAKWGVFSACSVGFSHSRERMFLLANTNEDGWSNET
jgi:hypothetical protein